VVVPWHYREGAWPGFERTLTVSNWAGGRGIPTTTLAPYREAPYTIGIGGKEGMDFLVKHWFEKERRE